MEKLMKPTCWLVRKSTDRFDQFKCQQSRKLITKLWNRNRVGCSPAKRPVARHPAGRTRRFAGPCRAKYLWQVGRVFRTIDFEFILRCVLLNSWTFRSASQLSGSTLDTEGRKTVKLTKLELFAVDVLQDLLFTIVRVILDSFSKQIIIKKF